MFALSHLEIKKIVCSKSPGNKKKLFALSRWLDASASSQIWDEKLSKIFTQNINAMDCHFSPKISLLNYIQKGVSNSYIIITQQGHLN